MPEIRKIVLDPVSRVAGDLALYVELDLNSRKIVDARTSATLFRGYELILKDKEPVSAPRLSSTICGVCGGVHAAASVMAVEMAVGVTPPSLAITMRNLAGAAEMIYDNSLHLFLLTGPDYSSSTISKTTSSVIEAAKNKLAEHRDIHGFNTIAKIMEAMNPLKGKLYLEALRATRDAREAYALMLRRYPHPIDIAVGGIYAKVSEASFTGYQQKLMKLLDWVKKVALIWEDLVNFLYEQGFGEIGKNPQINLLSGGIYDDPELAESGDLYKYEKAPIWGEKRMITPGVIRKGQLVTTNLVDINLGIEVFINSSYYEGWGGKILETDPLGNELSEHNPWNKVTKPKPGKLDWKEKYSWSVSPRWRKEVYETGPIARLWVTTLAGKIPENEFINSDREKLKISLPKGDNTPEVELEWRIPKVINALERNRARAYYVAYASAVAMIFLRKAFEYLNKGKTALMSKFEVPNEGIGVGFYEAARGFLTHYVIIRNKKIFNYQIVTPTTWNASPRDPWGNPGPFEIATMNTAILEDVNNFTGIDVLRAIRSFDPCMECAVHMFTGKGVTTKNVLGPCVI